MAALGVFTEDNPFLVDSGLANLPVPIRWLGGRTLEIGFA